MRKPAEKRRKTQARHAKRPEPSLDSVSDALTMWEAVVEATAPDKPRLDAVSRALDAVRAKGWTPGLNPEDYAKLADSGLRSKSLPLAFVAAEVAMREHPLTLRSLMYRLVSAGWLPSTDREHYQRLGRIMLALREHGRIPFAWLVDNVRQTLKPSSWSGLGDFTETVREAYRKDFWARLPEYVHIICEKDAVAGTLEPVTREYDVRLSPIRGYVSASFAWEIAEVWKRTAKPVHCYYLGDLDPSGFDLERDAREKLGRYCGRPFSWARLGVNPEDLAAFNLIPLKPKKSDSRYRRFVAEHGSQCAELDALPPTELRRRVREAIESHIPQGEWERLKEQERFERESFIEAMGKLAHGLPAGERDARGELPW
jgi:hypothetical protein